jgi:uncharacterized membrane protein (UPF0127 family)
MKKIISNKITRMDQSFSEIHKHTQTNMDMFMYFDRNQNNINSFLNQHNENDESNLYELWKNNQIENDKIYISQENTKDAHKLMNHGYLILNNDSFKLTEKGKKVIINKSLTESPENIYKNSNTNIKLIKKSENENIDSQIKNTYKEINFNNKKYKRNVNMTDSGKKVNIYKLDEGEYDDLDQAFPSEDYVEMTTWQENPQSSNFDTSPGKGVAIKGSSNISNSKLFGLLKVSNKKDEIINEFKNRKLKVALVADKSELQQKGLMFHPGLKREECVLFIFDKPNDYSFWNKNVSFPIDIAFFNSKGKLISISNLKENQLNSVGAKDNDIKYVIESNLNWFKDNNINVGDSIYDVLESL